MVEDIEESHIAYLVMVSVGKNCSSLWSRLRRVSVTSPAKASVSR